MDASLIFFLNLYAILYRLNDVQSLLIRKGRYALLKISDLLSTFDKDQLEGLLEGLRYMERIAETKRFKQVTEKKIRDL